MDLLFLSKHIFVSITTNDNLTIAAGYIGGPDPN